MEIFRNLAGVENCDEYISKELESAGINQQDRIIKSGGEVNSKILATFYGWTFDRAWYYYIARTETTPLLFKYADELHMTHGECEKCKLLWNQANQSRPPKTLPEGHRLG